MHFRLAPEGTLLLSPLELAYHDLALGFFFCWLL